MVDSDTTFKDMCGGLVDRGQLILTVKVNTVEDASQLIEWMYAPKKPMSAELIEMAWDKVTVSKKEGEVIKHIRTMLADDVYE